MTNDERGEFAELLSQALGFYRQAVTPFAISVWWNACSGYEIADVRKALTAHAMDPDRGHFAPMPADIVRQLHGTHSDRSLIAWGKVHDAMGRVGAYTSVVFDDGAIHAVVMDMGGWPAICRTLVDDLPFVQKRFCDLYRTYSSRAGAGLAQYPAKLMGDSESTNRLNGQPVAAPVLIGNPENARKLLEFGSTAPKTAITAFDAIPQRVHRAIDG